MTDSLRETRHEAAYPSDLTGLSSYARLFSWLIGESLDISGVDMNYPPHAGALMPYPIRHDAPRMLHFPAILLGRPIKRTPADLERWLSHFPFDPIEPQSSGTQHVELVERVLRSAWERCAGLKDEGPTLGAIKQQCRMDAAQRLLADPHLSVSEVARLTDYADFAALSRAFRSVTGLSPSAWRKEYFLRGEVTIWLEYRRS